MKFLLCSLTAVVGVSYPSASYVPSLAQGSANRNEWSQQSVPFYTTPPATRNEYRSSSLRASNAGMQYYSSPDSNISGGGNLASSRTVESFAPATDRRYVGEVSAYPSDSFAQRYQPANQDFTSPDRSFDASNRNWIVVTPPTSSLLASSLNSQQSSSASNSNMGRSMPMNTQESSSASNSNMGRSMPMNTQRVAQGTQVNQEAHANQYSSYHAPTAQIHITTTTKPAAAKFPIITSDKAAVLPKESANVTTSDVSFLKSEDGSFVEAADGRRVFTKTDTSLQLEETPQEGRASGAISKAPLQLLKTSKGEWLFNEDGVVLLLDTKANKIRPRAEGDQVDNVLKQGSPANIKAVQKSFLDNPNKLILKDSKFLVKESDSLLRTPEGNLILSNDGKKLKMKPNGLLELEGVSESVSGVNNDISPLRTSDGKPLLSSNSKLLILDRKSEKIREYDETKDGDGVLPSFVNVSMTPETADAKDGKMYGWKSDVALAAL